MKRWTVAAALAMALSACSGMKGPNTGQEFFTKMNDAAKKKDVDTLWRLLAKKSRDNLVNEMKDEAAAAKKNRPIKNPLSKKSKASKTPSAEDLGKELLGAYLEAGLLVRGETFVEEKAEGNQVIVVTKNADKTTYEIVLVREESGLRWDLEATDERESKKNRG